MSRSGRRSRKDREREAAMPDYGELSGIGWLAAAEPRLVVEGVEPGREGEFIEALRDIDDAASRRLLTKAKAVADGPEWDRELLWWVRKRLFRGFSVPASVRWRWRQL